MTSHRTVLIRYFGVNVIIPPLTGTDYFFCCKNTFMLFLESKRLETKLLALECQPPGHSYSKTHYRQLCGNLFNTFFKLVKYHCIISCENSSLSAHVNAERR